MPSKDQVLLTRGYPQQVLSSLCEEAKEEIYSSGSVFESATVQYYNEETGEVESRNILAGQFPPVLPRGQIKEKHLLLLWTVSANSDKSKSITFNYDWQALPLNRKQDPIGVSWDSSKFYLRTGSFHKVDYYKFKTSATSPMYRGIKSDEHSYAKGGEDGVSWYADLKAVSASNSIYNLYGYAAFTLVPKTSSGSSRLYGHYVHAKLSGSLSMSIPNFGSFSVSGGSSYDELGSQRDISW